MEEPQSHLTAQVTKLQIQGYVIISTEIKIMILRIKEATCDTSENNQHSSLTNYTNCKHPFLVTAYQIIYCIVSHMIYGSIKNNTTGLPILTIN